MRLRIKLEGRNLFLPFIFYFSYALKRGLYKNGKTFLCKKIKAYLYRKGLIYNLKKINNKTTKKSCR